MINKKLQVFISSTYEDLKVERQAAVETILKDGHIPAGMELFTSDSVTQLEIIKSWIDNSDIFLLILGPRYGSIEPVSQLGYTEVEYEYAKEKNKSIVSVVMSDKAMAERRKEIGIDINERENGSKYNKFYQKVKTFQSESFNEIYQMRLQISQSITSSANKYDSELTGWVSGKEVSKLQKEIERLKEEIINLGSKVEKSERPGTFPKGTSLMDIVKEVEKESGIYVENLKQLKMGESLVVDNVEITIRDIVYLHHGFQVNFSVVNNSSDKLRNYGRLEFVITPKIYEEEINRLGYGHDIQNDIKSQYIYPNQSFIGGYIWNTELDFKIDAIIYHKPSGNWENPVAKWIAK